MNQRPCDGWDRIYDPVPVVDVECPHPAQWLILPPPCHPRAEERAACTAHVTDFIHLGADCTATPIQPIPYPN